jgi:hypothetical protein
MKTNLATIVAASIGPDGRPDRARIYEALQVSPSDPVAITVEAALAAHESAAELLSEGRRQCDALRELFLAERNATVEVVASFDASIRHTADDLQRVTDAGRNDFKIACMALSQERRALKGAAEAFGNRALLVSVTIGFFVGIILGLMIGRFLFSYLKL